jgi:hypothetical protein
MERRVQNPVKTTERAKDDLEIGRLELRLMFPKCQTAHVTPAFSALTLNPADFQAGYPMKKKKNDKDKGKRSHNRHG